MEFNIKERLMLVWVVFIGAITGMVGFISMAITIIGIAFYYYYNCVYTYIRNKL